LESPAVSAVMARKIRVEIVASAAFRSQPNWRSEFEQRLAYASRIFESEFKVKFVPVKWREWPVVNEKVSLRALLEDLQSRFPLEKADIVIGLTSVKGVSLADVKDPDTVGQAKILSGYLVLRYPISPMYRIQEQTVLTHELGHLFGAVHTDEPSTVMFPIIDKQVPVRFDTENHDIIMATRAIDFKRGVNALPRVAVQKLLGSYLKMAVRDQPFDFFYVIGALYLQLGQYDDTLKSWKKAAEIMPDFPRIHYNLGMLYYQMGDHQNSVKELMQAVRSFRFPSERPEELKALKALGDVFMSDNDLVSAYQAYTRAKSVSPSDKEVRLKLAVLQTRKGQLQDAIRELEALHYQDTNYVEAMLELGAAYYQAQRHEDSARMMKRVIEKAKKGSQPYLQAHSYLGRIYGQSGQHKKAIDHFRTACAAQQSADCMKGLAQAYFDDGQIDHCIATLAQVLMIQKDDPDVFGTLAVALMQKGDYGKAYPLLEEGLKYAKDSRSESRFYQNMGHILIQTQKFDLAKNNFQMGLSRDCSNLDCYFGLAMASIGLQDPLGAKRALEDVLRIDPQNKKATEMLRQVEKILPQSAPIKIHLEGGSGQATFSIKSKK